MKSILIAGLVVRLLLSAVSVGTDDIHYWFEFASLIRSDGILALYEATDRFNHPVLAGYGAAAFLVISDYTSIPFPFVFRLPAIAADLFLAAHVYSFVKNRGSERDARLITILLLFNPLTLLMSSFHGNTDSIYIALMTVSVLSLLRGRCFLSGLLLGASMNVKVIPLLVLPVLLSSLRTPHSFYRLLSGLFLGCTPFGVAYLLLGPEPIISVFGYSPSPMPWGFSLLLPLGAALLSGVNEANLESLLSAFNSFSRYGISLGVVLIALLQLRREKQSLLPLAAAALSLFLLLSPGIGIQYLSVLVPLLLLWDLRSAMVYLFPASLAVCLVFGRSLQQLFPLEYIHQPWSPLETLLLLTVWVSVLVVFCSALRGRKKPSLP